MDVITYPSPKLNYVSYRARMLEVMGGGSHDNIGTPANWTWRS